ncbi:MAG: glycoside hydrolase, partial [Bacteroidetes bacterium]|nr:glycoside hydrolase [Bacteroidota bacterium]
ILFSSNTNFGLSNNSIQGWYMSTNGGLSWTGADVLPNNGLGRGDPSTGFDAHGYAYLVSMGPNATSSPDGYMVQRSTNSGSSWSSSIRGTGPTSGFDKEMIAVDNVANSPYSNYFYCGWTEFIGGNGSLPYAAVKLNRSTDGGQTFSSPVTLRQSGNNTGGGQGACLATGPQGEVYVCWADYSTGSVPANGVGFAKSTNGGTSFTSGVAFAYQGIRQGDVDPRFNNTRVNDFPSIAVDKSHDAYRGRIYMVYPNGGNGSNNQSVIQLRYSTDGGTSWSSAQTISISNGRQNWFPWIAVDDSTGDVSAIYYSLDGTSGFSTNTYVAHSINGGATWENIKVSDVAHTIAPIPGFLGVMRVITSESVPTLGKRILHGWITGMARGRFIHRHFLISHRWLFRFLARHRFNLTLRGLTALQSPMAREITLTLGTRIGHLQGIRIRYACTQTHGL